MMMSGKAFKIEIFLYFKLYLYFESRFFYISYQKEQLHKELLFEKIYPNKNLNYYLCDDLSLETYIKLCKFEFISTSIILENNFYLLPEIQFEYAIFRFQ